MRSAGNGRVGAPSENGTTLPSPDRGLSRCSEAPDARCLWLTIPRARKIDAILVTELGQKHPGPRANPG